MSTGLSMSLTVQVVGIYVARNGHIEATIQISHKSNRTYDSIVDVTQLMLDKCEDNKQ